MPAILIKTSTSGSNLPLLCGDTHQPSKTLSDLLVRPTNATVTEETRTCEIKVLSSEAPQITRRNQKEVVELEKREDFLAWLTNDVALNCSRKIDPYEPALELRIGLEAQKRNNGAMDVSVTRTMHAIAMALKQAGQHERAIICLKLTLEVIEERSDDKDIQERCGLHTSIGNIYRDCGMLELSLAHYKLSLKMMMEEADTSRKMAIINRIIRRIESNRN